MNATIALAGADWLLPLVGSLLLASMSLILLRLWRGPSQADRAVAIDALTLLGVAALVLFSLWQSQRVLLDVAVLLALLSFIGSAAYALLFSKTHDQEPPQ